MKAKFMYVLGILFVSCDNSTDDKGGNRYLDTGSSKKELIERANNYYQNDKYSDAISLYNDLIVMDSTKGGYYFKRGYCKSMLLNDTGAISDYRKAIMRNYSESHAAYLNIGVIYRKNGNYDSALYFYDQSLIKLPGFTKALEEKNQVLQLLNYRK
jgi:tetratricopeptide (TPR) repeat protein